MLLANFNRKEHLRHRAVSLRQHGFLVLITVGACTMCSGDYSFTVDDTSSFDEYMSGGTVTFVKQPMTLNFVSL